MRTLVCVILLAAAAITAQAANFSGKWAIQSASGRGGGRGGPTILTLNHVGNAVTGSLSQRMNQGSGSPVNQEILGGKVVGDTLTFYVWVGGDEPAKQTYTGTISGDELTLTVTSGRGGGGGQAPGGARGGAAPATPPAQAQTAGGSQQLIAKRTN
jgi:hypothetical protein